MAEFSLGWIDFSKEQRNKVLNVINLLSEPEAIDELGIGVVRDGFSDIFFPGTSTIQTRAKYFLIVPHLLYELEHTKGITAEKMIHMLHEQELDLIDILKQSGETGVIGENAGRKLKRKPSDIYWNGLKIFGIFKGGNVSLNDYIRLTCLLRNKKQALKSLGSTNTKDDENDADDLDPAISEFVDGFLNLPELDKNWREDLHIKLNSNEANFLKKQIIKSCPESLMGFVLDKNYKDILDFNNFDDIEGMSNILPDTLKTDYILARSFADFAYGIQLRYNMVLSKGEAQDINISWNIWSENLVEHSNIELEKILFDRLRIRNSNLIRFLFACRDSMKIGDISKLDQLIIMRDRRLKGDSRSKLYNADEFNYKGWVGLGKLQYRFKNGKIILRDIFDGLGDQDA